MLRQTPTKFLARNKIPFSMMHFKGITFSIMQMWHIFDSLLNNGVWDLYKCGRHQVEMQYYLLANVIDKVKIATISHIHVETTEITPKIPGRGFSKKKRTK